MQMGNTERELVETAKRIADWGERHGMSRAQLVRNFADLGSEKSFRDIDRLFGKTENWACVTYHRAKRMIREGLEDD